jgi:hypothetical protein
MEQCRGSEFSSSAYDAQKTQDYFGPGALRCQEGKSYELCAATSIARLWQGTVSGMSPANFSLCHRVGWQSRVATLSQYSASELVVNLG